MKNKMDKSREGEARKLAVVEHGGRALTAREFQGLSQVPPAIEWFANIRNEKTRRAYRRDM
jgi:hypothetical protein